MNIAMDPRLAFRIHHPHEAPALEVRVNFGVYADVLAEGVVRVGDPLDVRPTGGRLP